MCTWIKRWLACWGCSLAVLASAQTRITVINRSQSTWTLRASTPGPTAQCLIRLDGTRLGLDGSYTPGPGCPLVLVPGLAYDLTWDSGTTPAACIAFALDDRNALASNPFRVNLVAHWGVVPQEGPARMSLELLSLAAQGAPTPADLRQKLGQLNGTEFILQANSYQVFPGPTLVEQLLALLVPALQPLPLGPAAGSAVPMDLEPTPAAGAGLRKRPRAEPGPDPGPARKRARLEAKAPAAADPSDSDADESDHPPETAAAPRAKYGSGHVLRIRNESGGAWTLRTALRKPVAVATTAHAGGATATSTWAVAWKKHRPDVDVSFTIADGTTASFDLSASCNRIQRGADERLRAFHLEGADGAAAASARFQVASVSARVEPASADAAGGPAPGRKAKRRLPRILLDQASPAFARLALSERESCITILPPAAAPGAPAAAAAAAGPVPAPAAAPGTPAAAAAAAGPAPAAAAGTGQGAGGSGAGAGSGPAQPAARPAPVVLTIRNESIWDWSFCCDAPDRELLAERSRFGQKPAPLTPDQPARWDLPADATTSLRRADGKAWVGMAFQLVSEDLLSCGVEPVPFTWEATGPVPGRRLPELELEGDDTIVIRDPSDPLSLEDLAYL